MSYPSSSLRREAAVIAALAGMAAILRFWSAGTLGLNHFDEGIYAMAGLSMLPPRGISGIDPFVRSFAPPGFPILVSFSFLLFGVSDVAAILVSQVAGVLTIPAIGWVGRRTFGPGAGAMSAGLAAMSGPAVVFSRMALTDSTFLLCWVLAIGLGGRFLERPGITRSLAFGLAVGAAQNVKYNGYLAGIIVALVALIGCLMTIADTRRKSIRSLAYGVIAVLAASLVYWPWYRFVQSQPGGYASLLAHQRGYLGGWRAWPSYWQLQMAQSTSLSGAFYGRTNWGLIAWPISLLAGLYAAHGPKMIGAASRWASARVRLGVLIGALILGAAPSAPWWIGLASLPCLIRDGRPCVRILGVWWLVMAVLTPFYHPYARLWLPLHAAGWVLLGGFVPTLGAESAPVGFIRVRPVALAVAILIALIQDIAAFPHAYPMSGLLSPTDSLRLAGEQIEAAHKSALAASTGLYPPRYRVVGRPALTFYLGMGSSVPIRREEDLDGLSRDIRPTDWAILDDAVVLGSSYMFRGGQPFHQSWRRVGLPLILRGGLAPATLLDVDPSQAFERVPSRDSYLHVYAPIP